MQPGGERLLQADEEVPGQELAAVGVTAELEVEARGLRRGGAARLVREQDSQCGAGRAADERGARIAGLVAVEVAGAEIGDTGDDQLALRRAGRRRARS